MSTATSAVQVKRISSARDLKRAFAIRDRVFVREQGVPREIELDSDDQRACHLLALDAERAVGTARVVICGETAKIGRMAVLKRYRGRGIGTKLLKRAIQAARAQKAREIYLHAQISAIGFYETMGFRCRGPIFDEAGIPHRAMILPR
jgi:predicted GNAT family N-acyltransferase